ncbi:MAG TPA: hypothetical protein VFY80_10790, partial [Burkholderiales bacterium]|nr:hypothetical protein [Burkholderiales bacterium]
MAGLRRTEVRLRGKAALLQYRRALVTRAPMPAYSRPIASKLPQVGTTIFTVMSRLASEHNAINLSQGFPDFDCAA